MSLQSPFQQRTLTLDQSWAVTTENFPGTGHRFTRMCNNPRTASLDEILYLAERLNYHPLFLYRRYELGKDTLTDREINLLKEHMKLSSTLNTYQTDAIYQSPIPPGSIETKRADADCTA